MTTTRSHLLGAVLAVAVLAVACDDDETIDKSTVACPNAVPEDGGPCNHPGMVCNYFTGCEQFFPATCGDDLRWSFEDGCELPGTGGAGPAGTGGAGNGGGMGGSGGPTGAGGSGGSGGSAGGGGN